MNGRKQLSEFQEKQRLIDGFIETVNPYKKKKLLSFDLFFHKNGLLGEGIV